MKYIQLSQGKKAIVDDEDFEELNKWKWHFNDGYACRWEYLDNKPKKIRMHRFLANTLPDFETDHINQNKLDNRKENLRNCTKAENRMNRTKYKTNTSGIKGVYFHKRDKIWTAQLGIAGKRIHLGYFEVKEKATEAYNNASLKYHGEFAHLN